MVDVAHKHHVAVMQQLHEAPVSRYWLMQENLLDNLSASAGRNAS